MVPDGWDIRSLDSVTKVIDCKHRTPQYVKEGVPLVSPGTIKWGAIDLITPTKRVSTKEYISLMDHCTVNVGDLVLSRNQSVGVAAFVESEDPFVLGQDTVLVKPIEADGRFLFYNLQSVETQRTIFKLAGGSTFSRINLGDIRKLKAIYPPLPEQQKIATILSTWDKAISTTERLIDNSKQQKKVLMQQLLTGKKRLLDDSGKPFEGEWEEVKLGDVSDVRDGTHDSPSFFDSGYPLITSKNLLPSGKLDLDNVKFISEEDYEQINKRSNVNIGDILFGMIGTIGNPVRVCSNNYAIKNVALIKEKKRLLNSFLIFYISSLDIAKQFHRFNAGGTQKFIALGVIRNLVIRLPTQEEQQKLAEVLANADKEIELLEQQLADLKQEKKALMQQLLTGKRRVKVDDKEVA